MRASAPFQRRQQQEPQQVLMAGNERAKVPQDAEQSVGAQRDRGRRREHCWRRSARSPEDVGKEMVDADHEVEEKTELLTRR